ncbi:MAG: hypothetical protein AAFR70_09610, partial [Pseudomonadota bacterium]
MSRDGPHLQRSVELAPILSLLSQIAAFFYVVARGDHGAEQWWLELAHVPSIATVSVIARIAIAVRAAPLLIEAVLPGVNAFQFLGGLPSITAHFCTPDVPLATQLRLDLFKLGDVAAVGDPGDDPKSRATGRAEHAVEEGCVFAMVVVALRT